MTIGRQQPTATLLPNGRVLITGGWSTEGSLSSAELYDPSSATFTSTGSMSEGRYQNAAQLLPGGLVLVVGGECSGDHCGGVSGPLASSELYDPATGTFYPGGQMGQPRYGFASAILSDGSVLILGGQDEAGMLQTAEVYRSR